MRRDHLEISSILSSALGSLEFDYSRQSALDLSRSHLEPWWGAWRPVVLVVAGLAVAAGLLLVWSGLAWIYAPAAKLVAWFCDRRLSWPGAWRLAGAALLPGAVLMALGLVLYGWQWWMFLDLVILELSIYWPVGFTPLAAPAFAPRLVSAEEIRNPFHP